MILCVHKRQMKGDIKLSKQIEICHRALIFEIKMGGGRRQRGWNE